jgi:hypothetical protein
MGACQQKCCQLSQTAWRCLPLNDLETDKSRSRKGRSIHYPSNSCSDILLKRMAKQASSRTRPRHHGVWRSARNRAVRQREILIQNFSVIGRPVAGSTELMLIDILKMLQVVTEFSNLETKQIWQLAIFVSWFQIAQANVCSVKLLH